MLPELEHLAQDGRFPLKSRLASDHVQSTPKSRGTRVVRVVDDGDTRGQTHDRTAMRRGPHSSDTCDDLRHGHAELCRHRGRREHV